MHSVNAPTSLSQVRQRGQSIVVALLVLLLLGLAGALFVTIVARNIVNARRANRTVTADQYARAGITFADAQLSNSLEGADWRPSLQYALAVPPTEPREQQRYNAQLKSNANPNGLAAPDPNDPDLKYLEAGFARYNTGAGRFLLRLTYTPVLLKDAQGQYYDPVIGTTNNAAIAPVAVPPGKYIKIEAIGREGVIDPVDPTTYTNNRTSDRLQAYQVAYKPLGITDYARFETNLDSRSDTANIGVTSRFYADNTDGGIGTPGAVDFVSNGSSLTLDANGSPASQTYSVKTTYGAADAYLLFNGGYVPNPKAGTATKIDTATALPGGGSFHANMPVRFFGENVVYLNDAGANAPLYQDGFEVAGDLLLNGYDQTKPLFTTSAAAQNGQRTALILNPTDLANVSASGTAYVVPSNDTGGNGGFSTRGGLIRDGSPQTDSAGQPRSITRLEPPLMDAAESATGLPRYKALATLSPPRNNPDSATPPYPATASRYGYGQSIYINNVDDVQENSKTIGGGSTLVDQWMNRTNPGSSTIKGGWTGDFYEPPGVNITIGRLGTPGSHTPTLKSTFGIRMTLTAGKWPNPDGSAGTQATQTVYFDDINASNNPATVGSGNPDNDVLIYAEGNIRVHGIASADPKDPDTNLTPEDGYPRHITLVTNGTAYIEGSLLKGNPDSSITVLAHDYVCVNTTQFLAGPQSDENGLGTAPPQSNSDYLTFGADESRLIQELTNGLPNGGTAATAYATPLGLYISGRPEDSSLGGTQAEFDIVNPATGYSIRGANVIPFGKDANGQTGIWNPTFDSQPGNVQRQYVSLSNPALMDMSLTPNLAFTSLVQSDTRLLYTHRAPLRLNSDGTPDTTESQNLQLERVAILPNDVRIEAVLYAQTGSFFVIPGLWFNSDTNDQLTAFASTVSGATPGGTRIDAERHFPFYGQPIDLKITIDGAVSESQPADVANQTAWMLKWGWIPQYHGFASAGTPNTGAPLEPAGHTLTGKPAVGLQIIYNPQAGYPYHPKQSTDQAGYYLRSDAFGRPLPFSPRLPVSTGLLYAGESNEPPLLQ